MILFNSEVHLIQGYFVRTCAETFSGKLKTFGETGGFAYLLYI